MNQPATILPSGTRIRVHATIDPLAGMLAIHGRRKPGAVGEIHGVVGGYGGDVYWVRHSRDSVDILPYCFDEFELEETTPPDFWERLMTDAD